MGDRHLNFYEPRDNLVVLFVVVLFVQIIPEIKRRQIKRWLDAYEATRREKARAGSDQASGDDGAPTAR